MMSEKVENLLVPNKQMILQHLEFLFEDSRPCDDGKIEIAYTDTNGKPNKAEYFDVSDLEKAADFAVLKNQVNGVNVYVGGALRIPDCPPMGRSNLTDFYAAPAAWVDIDDEGAVEAAKAVYKSLPPSLVVVTGRAPYMRAQFWWKLMHMEESPDTLKTALAALRSQFNGDPAVVDPARIMRLGGTIAWPYKENRVVELTQVFMPEKSTKIILMHKLMAAYPLKSVAEQVAAGGMVAANTGTPKSLLTGKINIQKALELSMVSGHWWQSVRDAVAAMVGQGWNNQQIHLSCAAFKYGDYNQDTHNKEIQAFIETARRKYKKPEEITEYVDEFGEIHQGPPPVKPSDITATCIDDIDLDNIRPREFLYDTIVGRKYVSMIVAPAGAGKSIFTMQLAISAASNTAWGDWHPAQKDLNIWIYNNEEGQDELFRRIKAIMLHNQVTKKDFGGRFYIDSGETNPISIAKVNDNSVVHTPDYEGLKKEVLNRKIDLLIIDPFAETHSVTENSNEQIKDVVRLYRDIAFQANCAVLLVHHTRKGSAESAGDADSARGGGSQIGVVRRMFTLSSMTHKEAEKIGVPPEKRKWFVRFDDAKTNITAPVEATRWLKFKSIAIMNGSGLYPEGDKVGVLEHTNLANMGAEFADELGDEHAEVLGLTVEMMDGASLTMTTVPEVIDYIKRFSNMQKSDRRLREAIKNAIEKLPRGVPFVVNGEGHLFSIIAGKGAKNNAISITKKRVILEN
jgi:hypothetical protein